MYGYMTLEKQIDLIDTIVLSTNKLIPLLQKNNNLNDTIKDTLIQIFNFLSKVIALLPDVLVSEHNQKLRKEEVIISFEQVMKDWKNFSEAPEVFVKSWEEFTFWWREFNRTITKIDRSGNTIYLSMN